MGKIISRAWSKSYHLTCLLCLGLFSGCDQSEVALPEMNSTLSASQKLGLESQTEPPLFRQDINKVFLPVDQRRIVATPLLPLAELSPTP